MFDKKKVNLLSTAKFLIKRPHNPNFEVLSTIPLIWYMMKFYFYKGVDFFADTVGIAVDRTRKIKYANNNKKLVAKIHFLFGLDALKTNKLSDATLRFWLVSKFIKESPTLYYHLAVLNYLKGNIEKSIICLSKIKNTNKGNTKRVKSLINNIKSTNYDILRKLNIVL